MPGDTVTKRFHDQVAALGDRTAMRGRGPDGWREITWNEFGRAVRETALGLISLGVEPGDAVCILSSNRPEWHIADYATLCAAARSAPIYTTNSPHQVAYIAGHAEARVIFVDTEEQLQKVDKVRPDLPALQHVVVTDDYPESPDGFVLSLPSLRERGRALDAEQPGLYDQRWQSAFELTRKLPTLKEIFSASNVIAAFLPAAPNTVKVCGTRTRVTTSPGRA